MSELLEPAKKGDVERLKALLKPRRDPKAITAATFVAAMHGKTEAFQLLLESGGDPLAQASSGDAQFVLPCQVPLLSGPRFVQEIVKEGELYGHAHVGAIDRRIERAEQ